MPIEAYGGRWSLPSTTTTLVVTPRTAANLRSAAATNMMTEYL